MTIAADAADVLIGDFGEEITVYPQSSDEPVDSSDPMYFDESSSTAQSYTIDARVYNAPSEEDLTEYGFDEDTEMMIYEREDKIEEADEIEFEGQRFVVSRTVTNQLGSGSYIWIHGLVGL
jgi:hypothetical protein